MSNRDAQTLIAVQTLLRRTPREEFLADNLKNAVEPHIASFARHSFNVSVKVHGLFQEQDGGPENPDRDVAAEWLIEEIGELRCHFSEILSRLALAGKIASLDAFVVRRLSFSPEILEFIHRQGGASVLLDSVPRKLERMTTLLRDQPFQVSRGDIDSFSGTLMAARLIFKVIGGDSRPPSRTRA
jgi:hypothetical protein